MYKIAHYFVLLKHCMCEVSNYYFNSETTIVLHMYFITILIQCAVPLSFIYFLHNFKTLFHEMFKVRLFVATQCLFVKFRYLIRY